ncbi:MAG TPA: diguanylate cyclase [Burkholderiales bacterium]|nr:diguanylate cyclase [Burkholderiales bacterium]
MNTHDEGLRFLRRMYVPRMIGLALGGLCVGATLRAQGDATAGTWTALLLCALAWPHMAYWLGRKTGDPYRTELANLTVDSAIGGAWIALMKFSLFPSALLDAMLSMDGLAVGGPKLLARGAAALLAACVTSALAFGFEVRREISTEEIFGSLPLLVFYPMTVGIVSYRLVRRARHQNRLLSAMSRTDSLSGLLNRRSWEDAVSAEFQRCRRGGRVAALLMLDIDHFKRINDRHGHPAGDEVIRRIAAVLRTACRQEDMAGRYGGEEFGIVLPETGDCGARVIAERVRRRIEDCALPLGIRCTVSIGVAERRPGDSGYAEWISRADRALYAAKERGRNRIEVLEPAPAF